MCIPFLLWKVLTYQLIEKYYDNIITVKKLIVVLTKKSGKI